MITFDGDNKIIEVSTATSFNALDFYNAAKEWEDDIDTMQYLSPMDAIGKADLGNSVYTDQIFKLLNGWKVRPSGYSPNIVVTISGTFVSGDGSSQVVPPISGEAVTWLIQATTAATIIATGSGVTSQDKLDIADEVMTRGLLKKKEFLALK